MIGALLVLLFIVIGIIYSFRLKVNYLKLSTTKSRENLKLMQISDLHSSISKKGFEKIIELSVGLDGLLLTGDIFNDKGGYEVVEKLLASLKRVKIYYVTGNHENRRPDLDRILALLESYKVILLDGKPQKLKDITIYGVNDILNNERGFYNRLSSYEQSLDRAGYNILLSHRPEYADHYLKFDLIFTGHLHGGHVRLPFIGGIFGPSRSLFPKYQKGLYQLNNDSKMYVNTGITNRLYLGIPRFYNPTEILIIEINGEKK